MRKIGYARVSSIHQNLDGQLGALRAERVDVIYREKVSGRATRGRPELAKAINELSKGDILVVAEWDRATRSMFDGIHIIERINTRGALIKVLDKPHLDLTTPLGRGFIVFLSALAEASAIASSSAPTMDAGPPKRRRQVRPQAQANRASAKRGPQAPRRRRSGIASN